MSPNISSARQFHEESQLAQKKEAQKQKEVSNNLIKGAQLNSTLTEKKYKKCLINFKQRIAVKLKNYTKRIAIYKSV